MGASNTLKVIGIGDNVCDKYVHLGTMFPGGQALNFSVYTRMLGADASYMGVFGDDAMAAHVIKTLRELHIETSRCRQYSGENGCARVTLDRGDRIFLGSNRGGVAGEHPICLTKEDLDYIGGFSLVHTSNNSHFEGPLAAQLARITETGAALSYDFSGQWIDEERVAQAAPYASYAFLSCGAVTSREAEAICRRMHEAGCRMVIATRGSLGAMLFDGRGFYEQPPELVEAVDTLGAGDSFAAAFLLSFTESLEREAVRMREDENVYQRELRKALKKGALFASETCLIRGAFGRGIPYPE